MRMGWMVRANKSGVPTNALVASVLVSTYTKWEREMCCLSHLCLLRHKQLHGAPVTIGFSTSLVALLLVFAFLTGLFWQDQRQVTCIRTSAEQEGDNSWWNGGQRLRGQAGALWNSLREYGCPLIPVPYKYSELWQLSPLAREVIDSGIPLGQTHWVLKKTCRGLFPWALCHQCAGGHWLASSCHSFQSYSFS